MREMSRYQDMPVGPYHLTKLVGVGPVSRVFLAARQDRAERLVALKLFEAVPLDLLAEKDEALDEVRLLACLEHSSILPTLDDGLHEHMLYLVMPYIETGSLRQRLTAATAAGELLPLKEVMAILRQVGEALQYAHMQRIVHANLKPENILLPGDGRALLSDFLLPGLVRSARAARILSTFAAFYMAPEQFQGVATPLSDQYALACLAYELLTGRPPFDSDDVMSLARKHATSSPRPPSQLQSKRAQHIDHVLLKALAKRPEERYPDILTFLTELSAPPPLIAQTPTPEIASPALQTSQAASVPAAEPLARALPPSLAFFDQETVQQPPQPVVPVASAFSEQSTVQQAPQPVVPVASAFSEQPTVQQVPFEVLPVAMVPSLHEAPTIAVPTGVPGVSPVGAGPQLAPAAQGRAQQATWRAYTRRAQSTSSLSRRQLWLAVGLVALAMLVTISGLAIFLGVSSANHSPSHSGGSTLLATTATPGQTPTLAPTDASTPTAVATPSPTATPVTPTPGITPTTDTSGLSCQVDYRVSSRWSSGFVATITITNTGNSTLQGWSLTFSFTGNEQITNGWNGKFTQNGAQVTITDAGFNSSLAPGASVTPGFQASSADGSGRPDSFSLNGVACSRANS